MAKVKAVVLSEPVGPSLFSAPPAGKEYLRLRNASEGIMSIDPPRGVGGPNLVLHPWMEAVVPTSFWQNNHTIKHGVDDGTLEIEWVDARSEPRRLPSMDDAPAEAQPEKGRHKQFAWQIVTHTDPRVCIEMINATVMNFGTHKPDKQFYVTHFEPLLNLVLWLEPQIQNRPQIITAAEKRLREIKAM